jgi:hypothetical protein
LNYSRSIFLINDIVRAVECIYEVDTEHSKAKRSQFKTLDLTIKVGDFVVVPTDTRHNMTVVKVVGVNVDVDLDSPVQMEWVIGTVQRADYEALLEKERDAIETIKSAEKKQKRDAMRKAIFENHPEMLAGLQLTHIEGTALPVEPPKGPAE